MIELLFFILMLFIVAILSRRIDSIPLTPQMIFIFAGIVVGWLFTGYVDIIQPPTSTIILLIAEIALVLVLFSDASQIRLGSIELDSLTSRLLVIGLPLTIVLGIATAIFIFTDLTFWETAIIGVVLAPTDAALGQVVVQNKRIPQLIRKSLEVESGLNDGLCVPFLLVFVAIGLAEESFSPVGYFLEVAIMQIGVGVLVGIAVGIVGSKIVIKSRDKGWITPEYQRIAFLALALLSFVIADQTGGSGFIAAFVGGLATAYVTLDARKVLMDFAEAEGQFLNLAVFFILGIVISDLIPQITWHIILYAILSLTVIRILPVTLSLIGSNIKWDSTLFMGWFGPRGLASVVLALIALERLSPFQGQETFILTVFITVFFSVIAHGITALPFSKLYLSHED
ncbi:sodium:proton exchanger [Methanobacterium sp. MZ-A1]|uniref:Sodium:proton exchanger n=1 Tax=Methanobacterium subterraneum TaxID=59277 RepID=A0A2H4VN75_9EURY|nr:MULTISPECIES: cation:proton antiporter [Methanobacterium]AUB56575.1 sodium:proton exchanger [Methanobacterium subterraneum]AUB58430.1 sodium:proton exchanger [Methanobacterium sp. MZ-A1]AUB59551.1 sodium:proton exchanger [Methanobacterium subterraneum]MBW4257235.1 cation:proton antiporter [Methanobacterium sp. YSL]